MSSIKLLSEQAQPKGFFPSWGYHLKHNVKVDESIQVLPFQLEIEEVIHLYEKRRAEIEESGTFLATGFMYLRAENQILAFDVNKKLVDILQYPSNPSASEPVEVKG